MSKNKNVENSKNKLWFDFSRIKFILKDNKNNFFGFILARERMIKTIKIKKINKKRTFLFHYIIHLILLHNRYESN